MKLLIVVAAEEYMRMVETDIDANGPIAGLAQSAHVAQFQADNGSYNFPPGFNLHKHNVAFFRFSDLAKTEGAAIKVEKIKPLDPKTAIATLKPYPTLIAVPGDAPVDAKVLRAVVTAFGVQRNEPFRNWIADHCHIADGASGPDVFLSYSTKDAPIAEEIAAEIRRRGFQVFLAHQTITAGPPWEDQVADAARSCRVAVLVVSVNSRNSDWVRYEIGALWALGKHVAPALVGLDVSDLPELLRKYQGRPASTSVERKDFCDEVARLLAER